MVINPDGINVTVTGDLVMYVRKESDSSDRRLKVRSPPPGSHEDNLHEANHPDAQLVSADVTLRALVQLFFSDNGQRMGGSMNVTELKLTKTYSRLDAIDQISMDELADLSKGMLAKMANGALQKGMPLPKIKGVAFRQPALLLRPRYALVNSYFIVDEDYVDKIIQDAVAKTVNRQG